MKTLIFILICSFGLILNSCKKNSPDQEYPFEANVLSINDDCGLYAIQFTKNLQKANEIAGTLFTEYTFIAYNLPADLQIVGLPIVLNIRRIQPSELGPCTARGPSFPWIYVLDARKKL